MKNLLILFCFISMAATCQDKQSDKKETEENPCDPDIMCTMEFRIIFLEVEDKQGNPVELDDFYTSFDDFEVRVDKNAYQSEPGKYPVATDGQMKQLSFEGDKGVFVGIKNGEQIIKHPMVIGKDCCHVQLVEGEKEIIID